MAFGSIKNVVASAAGATPIQFDDWRKSWRAATASGSTEPLLTFIARECGLAEDVFMQKLAGSLGWPYLEINKLSIPAEARSKISTKVAFQYSIMPSALENDELQVATSDPFDAAMASAVRFDAHMPVRFALAPKLEIEKALKKYYGVGAETLDEMEEGETMELEIANDKEITADDQDASVIKFVNQIIWEAYKDRSTDIHFEPSEDELRIRYRIDGILHQTPMPAQLKKFQAALISRIKVMSGMNIAEKRLPQDGRINVRIKGEEIDIRVSTVPTVYGESVSLRLLTRGKIFLSLDKLGFTPQDETTIRDIIVKPHGIFLVTGPTGSGKSTSLYAFLSAINSVHKRIITIEEPVEYELKGINQIAVRPDIGLTFAMGLRHILRQDPNVVMVGEIRDMETAEIAIRASLTGHLVFSTLHTNDAPSAFTRLIDMGIEPFLVASSVEAVMAQRLIRTICPHCKTEKKTDADYLRRIGFPVSDIGTAKFSYGAGCEECRQQGYQGRKGIYELLVVSESIRPLIMNRAPASTISQHAIKNGMRVLRADGWNKVKNGETTIEEILRVTQSEENMETQAKVDRLGERGQSLRVTRGEGHSADRAATEKLIIANALRTAQAEGPAGDEKAGT
ncbi:MAG TPA: GspE/PulE family protein [Pseudomonadales bacterium]|nr:GspE/PulE family protein [Pseudomonadales bacterium]